MDSSEVSGSSRKMKRFIYAKKFHGEPKATDFKLKIEDIPELKDGEILCEAEYLSVDPYMRPYMERFPVGVTMIGGQVAKIIESKSEDFPKGSYVFGQFGWRTHTVYDTKLNGGKKSLEIYLLPSFGRLPRSLAVGILGMPGNTAYFGFLDLCQPKEYETVVVSGAAGAVGSIVGQIAKIKKCKVIGIAGSKDKCEWLVKKIGFDHAINYKVDNIKEKLQIIAPNGIDCYFDNTGGEISSTVINQMNKGGRVAVCGSISSYNTPRDQIPLTTSFFHRVVFWEIKMEGFLAPRFTERWFEGIENLKTWVDNGKMVYQETVTTGFDRMPKAFIEMLRGENFGKAVVKV